MLCASFLAVFLCAVAVGLPLFLDLVFFLFVFAGIFCAHCLTPLLLFLYFPLSLKFWQAGRRGLLLFCITGFCVAGLNGVMLGLLIQGGQGIMGTDPFDLEEVFRVVPVYLPCGFMTGALHWLFLTWMQRNLEKKKIHGTP